jgi:hypothetical protein
VGGVPKAAKVQQYRTSRHASEREPAIVAGQNRLDNGRVAYQDDLYLGKGQARAVEDGALYLVGCDRRRAFGLT